MHSKEDYELWVKKGIYPKMKSCTKLINREFKKLKQNLEIDVSFPLIKTLNVYMQKKDIINNGIQNSSLQIIFTFPFFIEEFECEINESIINSIFSSIIKNQIGDILKFEKDALYNRSISQIKGNKDHFHYNFSIDFELGDINIIITKYKLECILL